MVINRNEQKNRQMQEKFHKSKIIPKAQLIQLMNRKDNPALGRFLLTFSLFIFSGAWIVWSWEETWLHLIMAHIVFGLLCCSMFAALHEAGHGTAFKSKKLNQIVSILAGIAHFYPTSIFRELHFTHHRHTHIPGLDPEISIGDKPGPAILTNPPIYLAFLTGIPYLYLKLNLILLGVIGSPEIIRKKFTAYIRPKMRVKIAIESFFFVLIYGGFGLLAWYIHTGFWGIFTGQIVGHCFLSMYLVMEHNGLPHAGNILDRTRSIQTNKLVNFLLWNMPYHAEHHAFPAVPFHALPALHEAMKSELKHKEKGLSALHVTALQNFGLKNNNKES